MTHYPPSHPPPPNATSAPAPSSPKNGLGAAALALAVVGLVCSLSVLGGVLLGVVAIILGVTGRRRARLGEASNGEVATSGMVLGALAIVVSLAAVGIWVRGYQEVDFGSYVKCLSSNTDPQHVDKCANEFRQRVADKFGVE
jgi:hypothetical protein